MSGRRRWLGGSLGTAPAEAAEVAEVAEVAEEAAGPSPTSTRVSARTPSSTSRPSDLDDITKTGSVSLY